MVQDLFVQPQHLQIEEHILQKRRLQFMVVEYLLGIKVVLLFNGVEDLKGFKVRQLVPSGSLEELKGFQQFYNSTMLRIEGSSSPCSHTQGRNQNNMIGGAGGKENFARISSIK
ncbi:hypothetical protein M9H77_02188 [Catharanthus roseus]|uniref:Uncharacterized protein n=1 Tax=Catharanthus roseus TaxID=4058 RepID=A0ACC0C7R7_CATRO|nr:hypothetical protein M9H77_02188 [Catharanthus roseus]